MPQHKVAQGDCMLSIAAKFGIPWETIWKDAANDALRNKRKHPTILFPGDVVQIPEVSAKEAEKATDAKHKFRRKAAPAKLRMRLMEAGKPLANTKYTISTDGPTNVFIEATTDGNGKLEQDIDPRATVARLRIGDKPVEHELKLGWLDPIDTTSGLQARLNNLGFDCGDVDGDMGRGTRDGMNAYRRTKKKKAIKNPDQETRDDIEKDYGC